MSMDETPILVRRSEASEALQPEGEGYQIVSGHARFEMALRLKLPLIRLQDEATGEVWEQPLIEES
jgi:ParB-like chromosome segregation protein Spo0J